jgi:hypothetical protein
MTAMEKYSSKGRRLQPRRRNPARIEVIVSRWVRAQLESLAEYRNKTISGVASEIIARHFGVKPTGRIVLIRVRARREQPKGDQ